MASCNPKCTVDVAQSKQPTSLMSLPLELRLDIYRHLLLTERPIIAQSPGYYNYHGIHPIATDKDLSLSFGILRVSRAVYKESSTVLYEENRFQYHCQAEDDGSLAPFKGEYSRIRSAKIKHIDLFCHQKWTTLTAGCVSTILEHFKTLSCSLKILRLHFILKRTYRISNELQEPLSRSVVDNAFERYRILNSMHALQVQRRIEVNVNTEVEEYGQGYEFLVNAAAARLGWKAELWHCERPPSAVRGGPGAGSIPQEKEWSWDLQPESGAK